MATHDDVARRFGQFMPIDGKLTKHRPLKASRMRVEPNALFPLSMDPNALFRYTAMGISYDTCVALLVYNQHTSHTEIWLHHNSFSPSTRRHKDMYRSAYISQCRATDTEPRIYHTNTGSTFNTNLRHHSHMHRYIHGRVEHYMIQAAHSGVHTATRLQALRNIVNYTSTAIRHMTVDLPADCIDTTMVQEFAGYITMAETMMQTPESIKAAAQGWLALNDITPRTY
jgi:hypothetical protein